MHITPEDKEKLSQSLVSLIDVSSRALVALRKKDHPELLAKLNELSASITEYVVESGAEIFPVEQDLWANEQTKR